MAQDDWKSWSVHVISELKRLDSSISTTNDRIEKLSEKTDTHLDDINKTMIKNTALLEEHMRRTELAEENLKILRGEVEPIKTHVAAIRILVKVVGVLGTVVGIAVGIAKIMDYF